MAELQKTAVGWQALPRPQSIGQLLGLVAQLGKPGWVHRGEPRWFDESKSSLGRYLRADAPKPIRAEAELIQYFRHRVFPTLSDQDRFIMENMIGVLLMMQHYGAPTRLLDWSRSPWIGAFHAMGDNPGDDGVIWSFDGGALTNATPAKDWTKAIGAALDSRDIQGFVQGLNDCPECILSLTYLECTDRMAAQQGSITIAHPAIVDHRVKIASALQGQPGSCSVLVVPSSLKQALCSCLVQMNIDAGSLYPGHDGVGRAAKHVCMYKVDIPNLVMQLDHPRHDSVENSR